VALNSINDRLVFRGDFNIGSYGGCFATHFLGELYSHRL
jgi:hypothetical protein